MNRKNFLKSISVIASASLVRRSSAYPIERGQAKLIPIIDSHQHLVDFKRFGENWANPPVPGNYGIREYKQAVQGLNLIKAVYMEVAVAPENRQREAQYVMELCNDQSNPTVGAVIAADIYSDDFKNYIRGFSNSNCIKGVRVGFRSKSSLRDENIIDNIRFLGDMNMRLDFIVPPDWFGAMGNLIKSCPDTLFQADHCANADPKAFSDDPAMRKEADHSAEEWIDGVYALADNDNVVCKISGLVSRMPGYHTTAVNDLHPVIDRCFEIFGTSRVMFASDWPWCLKGMTLKGWVNLLKQVVKDRPEEVRQKLFYANAERHYNI